MRTGLLFLEIVVIATSATCAIALVGRRVMALLRVESTDQGMWIVAGAFPLLAALWYAQETRVWVYLVGGYGAVCVALFVRELSAIVPGRQSARALARAAHNLKGIVAPILPTTMCVTLLYIVLTKGSAVSTYINNDIFNWFAVAGTLVGKGSYPNISPDAPGYWELAKVDAFGTNWLLALLSLPYGSAIRATPGVTVVAVSWIALALQDLLKRFDAGRFATPGALFLVTSPFFLFVVFNGFFAQLFATFAAMVLARSAVDVCDERFPRFGSRVVVWLIPLGFLFCVYQSGFVVFLSMVLGFAAAAMVGARGMSKGLVFDATSLAAPLLASLLLLFGMLPEVGWHLLERTTVVGTVQAGWPLPLIPSHVFLFVPWLEVSPDWMRGGAGGSFVGYVVAVLGVACTLSILLARPRAPGGGVGSTKQLAAMWVWYFALMLVYVVWYRSVGPSYQAWKFASFFSFAMSFIPIATVLALMRRTADRSQSGGTHGTRTWPIVAIVCAVAALVVVQMMSLRDLWANLLPLDARITQLERIRDRLPAGSTVEIDLAPYGPTMLAMSMLSRDALLLPLSQTYLPRVPHPATVNHVVNRWVLMSSACKGILGAADHGESQALIETDDFVVTRVLDVGGYAFQMGGGSCYGGMGVVPLAGFSGPEPWGTWNDGSFATIRIELPASLQGSVLRMSIGISGAYVVPNIAVQRVTITADDDEVFSGQLSGPGVIEFDVLETSSAKGTFDLRFHFPDATSPRLHDPNSSDPRMLAIGFRDLLIRSIKDGKFDQ